jgi:exopolysaccharide biosynthesis predicted pyruvyltransferase EpsI
VAPGGAPGTCNSRPVRNLTSVPAVGLIDDLAKTLDEVIRSVAPAGACALVDYPDYSNVGDSAIWLGERALLHGAGFRVVYCCSVGTYSEQRLRTRIGNGPIFLSGGGNLGDLWPRHQELREAVTRAFPHNKIIQLPQTIWFREQPDLIRARAIFDDHPDLTILVRDQRSLEFARNELRATSLLCPDMAFGLGPLQRLVTPDQEIACLLRQDIESVWQGSTPTALDAVTADWLTDQDSVRLRFGRFLTGQCERHPRFSNWGSPILAPLLQLVWDGLARDRVRRGCAMLSRGRVVITDRLHGHILCLLLGIQHVVLDNSYGKVSSFYQTWTQRSALVHWADTLDEAATLARALVRNG